jgi:SAM-dependent methyltransferase
MAESDRVRWDQRYRQASEIDLDPPGWLKEIDSVLPRQGYALDIAAGTGRLAIWLAGRGLDVLAVDISQAGLELARQEAVSRGLVIETLSADLEAESLPKGPFDVITCFNYRQRNLFPPIRERLKVGSLLLAEVATVPNLERNTHPSLRYLAELGELRQDCAPLEIVYYQEGWFGGRASARVLARKVS